GWTENVLYNFTGTSGGNGPNAGVIFDQAGNLYGTTSAGGNPGCNGLGCGTVFQLTPSASGWTENVLYSFQNGSDGANPIGGLIFDPSGNLYGTTGGVAKGTSTVFKLAPSGGGWTYTSLHDFCAGGAPCRDGAQPWGNVVLDANGNLYGTASAGGTSDYGVVFQI